MDSPALVIILSVVFLFLLTYGYHGLREGLGKGQGDSAAFGAAASRWPPSWAAC